MCSPKPKHSIRTADLKITMLESQNNFVKIVKTQEQILLFLSKDLEWTYFFCQFSKFPLSQNGK